MKNLIRIFTLLILSQQINAQIKEIKSSTANPIQYSKIEWNISLESVFRNPYIQQDISLDVLVTTPSGRNFLYPCFFISGESGKKSTWGARFTPQETGLYRFAFMLRKQSYCDIAKSIELNVLPSEKSGFLHTNGNWTLKFDNGKPFRGIGENICWESRANDDSKYFKQLHENPRFNYDYLLSSLAQNGGNFFRTWICSWNLPIDWKNNFNNNRYTPSEEFYNPSAIQRLDRMLEISDSLNLYIMLTIGPGKYLIDGKGQTTSPANFFESPEAKELYQNRLRYLVARWGYSTNIAAWEFFNEIDNIQFSDSKNPIDPNLIVKWHDEMSQYLKYIDPYNHIVTTSISHRDLAGLNSIPTIDINQKHIYKNTSAIPPTLVNYENKFQKPYVIGEFGYEWDWSKNFNEFANEMNFDYKRGLWYGLFSPTPVLPMSWWWEFFDEQKMTPYIKSVGEINAQMLAAGNGSFDTIHVEAGKNEAYGVKCGNKVFIYLLNNTKVSVATNVIVNIPGGTYNIQKFIPGTGLYSDLGKSINRRKILEIKKIKLNPREEMVLILDPEKNI